MVNPAPPDGTAAGPGWGRTSVSGGSITPRLEPVTAPEGTAPGRPLTGEAAELATLRALRDVAFHFADTWAELLTSLPDSYDCHMNCAEANAAARLYRAMGDDRTAAIIIGVHAEHDDEEEREAHRDEPENDGLPLIPQCPECGLWHFPACGDQ